LLGPDAPPKPQPLRAALTTIDRCVADYVSAAHLGESLFGIRRGTRKRLARDRRKRQC
jgi:hypothetical protein